MDYEKKYKEAFIRARSMYESRDDAELAAYIFPELAESEDERIRNEILIYIGAKQDIDLETHNRWCTYLEKQKEQKSTEWKPTEEQFNYLAKAIMTLGEEGDCKTAGVLSEIRKGLKCSFPDWKVSPDYPEEGCNVSLNGEVKKIQEWSEDFDKEVESVHKRYPEVSFAKLTRIAHHFAKWADKYKSTEWSEQKPRLIGEDSVEKMARQMYETGQTIQEQKSSWSEEDKK